MSSMYSPSGSTIAPRHGYSERRSTDFGSSLKDASLQKPRYFLRVGLGGSYNLLGANEPIHFRTKPNVVDAVNHSRPGKVDNRAPVVHQSLNGAPAPRKLAPLGNSWVSCTRPPMLVRARGQIMLIRMAPENINDHGREGHPWFFP